MNIKYVYVTIMLSSILLFTSKIRAEGLDGYDWQKLPDEYKTVMVTCFIRGYTYGTITGSANTVKSTFDFLETYKNSILIDKKDIKSINNLVTVIKSNPSVFYISTVSNIKNLNTDVDFYAKEVDSFLMTYPLCRKKDIFTILFNLSLVWYKTSKSYKDFSEECLTIK